VINSTANKDQLDSIMRACRLISRMNKNNPSTAQSEMLYYKMLEKYYTNIAEAKETGKFVAAHTVFFPAEIFYGMDIVPMHTEVSTWSMSLFTGMSTQLVSAGAQLGLASEICTPHRGLAGGYATGALPRPDAVIWSNLVCDNTAKSGELLMEINQCPGFFIDHPFKRSGNEEEYLTHELEDMVQFLEETSGHKMDWDKMSEIVAGMDYQIQLYREIAEFRKTVPSPFRFRGFLELLTADYLFPGQPEAIEYLETLRDELQEMVAEGKGAVKPEQFRIMTFFLPPMYLIATVEKIMKEHGATGVIEPFFTLWDEGRLDPSKPLESVAKKSYLIPEMRMYGPLDDRAITAIVDSAKDFKVDGAIYYADVGCRHTCATIKLFKDLLAEIDVPVLAMDCDVVDSTITTEEELREKLDRFFEMLEER
jgi:benzoyl-CoA reductase/2-hydroxyglutaryl-CoA dehydratase subunit BcrC/BadD/HgdB